jgi:chemotaxis protein MotA
MRNGLHIPRHSNGLVRQLLFIRCAMSTSAASLTELSEPRRPSIGDSHRRRRPDILMLTGIVLAVFAIVAGTALTGVSFSYFFQPTGFLIVVVGTIGVMLITTPRNALWRSFRRVVDLFCPARNTHREDLIEEIAFYARVVRTGGLLAIEPLTGQSSDRFLQDSLLLALDVKERPELQMALENKLRLIERQGEAAAKVLEVAGGFAPTIGVLGTVVGLIDVLRQFTTLSAVANGMGTAFVSTIYGLALANLVLLPAAHRIRAQVAEVFENQELMIEGCLCLFDGVHPLLVRQRLSSYLHEGTPR